MATPKKVIITAPIPASNIDRSDRKECYRTNSALGDSLTKTMEEMVKSGKLPEVAAKRCLIHYDVHVAGFLSRATPRLNFKAEEPLCYKILGGVHQFLFQNVTVDVSGLVGRDRVSASVPSMGFFAYPGSSAIRKKGNITTTLRPGGVACNMPKFSQEKETTKPVDGRLKQNPNNSVDDSEDTDAEDIDKEKSYDFDFLEE